MAQITLLGQEACALSYVIRDWCYKAKVEVTWQPADLAAPQVVLESGAVLVNPSLLELAEAVGFKARPRRRHYDTVIVGAGPAGLSAAIYAGSEGLETCLIEKYHIGGQAGSTSFIENMLGYADGVSGCDFAADALRHVLKFPKIDLVSPVEVIAIEKTRHGFNLFLAPGTYIWTRTVIVATGMSYRKLSVPGAETFFNRGVFYGASLSEASRYRGQTVTIVGGGNSAGQAALYFALYAKRVQLVTRRPNLTETMSDYLVQRIAQTSNILLKPCFDLIRVSGSDRVKSVTLRSREYNNRVKLTTNGVFIFIGGAPHSEWLKGTVGTSPDGYILTGANSLYATDVPGIFAVGDVRYGSTKRVVTAAGEGAAAVNEVHRYLALNS